MDGLDAYPHGPQSAACTQTYHARTGSDYLDNIQGATGLQLQHTGGWTPIRVRGLPGRAAVGVITWREQGLTDAILAGGGMTTGQLVAIADSAPGP
ncbi:MAG TPA: hypothetical protein VLM11_17825 [Streptosporangiaceae bacterium]|nr:hypothetical protein [Streptosporangiaceae bacterium]